MRGSPLAERGKAGNRAAPQGKPQSRALNADENKGVLNAAAVPKTLESQLKISLPDDLGEALSNGTVLCQLANHVRPRSVSIIHVPSPAVVSVSLFNCASKCERQT